MPSEKCKRTGSIILSIHRACAMWPVLHELDLSFFSFFRSCLNGLVRCFSRRPVFLLRVHLSVFFFLRTNGHLGASCLSYSCCASHWVDTLRNTFLVALFHSGKSGLFVCKSTVRFATHVLKSSGRKQKCRLGAKRGSKKRKKVIVTLSWPSYGLFVAVENKTASSRETVYSMSTAGRRPMVSADLRWSPVHVISC